MIMDLETIQKMWEKDSHIDIDEIHNESIQVSQLHAKYYDILNNLILLRARAKQQEKNIRHERYEYYTGKADPEVYIENPFPKKIRDKETLQKYLDADEKLSEIVLKMEYYDVMVSYLESIIKQIFNRSYQIKNSIEWHKFTAGYNT
jgi:uncharacterized protein (DUF952 family)